MAYSLAPHRKMLFCMLGDPWSKCPHGTPWSMEGHATRHGARTQHQLGLLQQARAPCPHQLQSIHLIFDGHFLCARDTVSYFFFFFFKSASAWYMHRWYLFAVCLKLHSYASYREIRRKKTFSTGPSKHVSGFSWDSFPLRERHKSILSHPGCQYLIFSFI